MEVLQRRSQPLSAQEIFMELRGGEQAVGLATVYRAVSALKDEGTLQQVDLGDSQAYYQIVPVDSHSHHHLICTSCRQVLPLSNCPVSDLEDRLSAEYDFAIDYHVLEFYGTCAACRA
jgi:Fur family ferric uptake transcriptional regulator